MEKPIWSRYDTPEKIDERWSIIKYTQEVNGWYKGYDGGGIYGLPQTKSWYNVIDNATGYIVNVLPKAKIKPFIKLFESMEYRAELVNLPDHDIPVCVYTSSCGKFKIRSWTPFKGGL
jgi:hypothetical protein